MTEARDITVIGAGIAGMCCALQLLRDGHRVTVLDRDGPGEGCSFGNAGLISPSTSAPLASRDVIKKAAAWMFDPESPLRVRWGYLPRALPWFWRFARAADPDVYNNGVRALCALHAEAFTLYDSMIDTSTVIKRLGQLQVFESDATFEVARGINRVRREAGATVEELDTDALRQMVPELSPIVRHALFFPDNGHTVNPNRLVNTIADRFVAEGGTIRQGVLQDFETKDGAVRALVTDTGTEPVGADSTIVISAGAWSQPLAKQLGDAIPLEAERGYHLELPEPGVMPRISLSAGDRKFTMTPMENGFRLAGTAEFAGREAAPDYRRSRLLFRHAREYFPGLQDTDAREWMGRRPSTPDSLPVIDRASRYDNIFYAFGHGHTGLSGSPMTGKLITDMIAGREPSIDATPFRLGRF
jgi:D-amino-acid dehydrogenase